jgi:hypothetical protein
MLRADLAPKRADVGRWLEKLVFECKERLALVLPLAQNEQEFLEHLNGAGDIRPELLTSDGALQAIIREHAGIKWKAFNVKRHRAGGAAGEADADAE